MELKNLPSLPDAHQQIRLGDIQASTQKWTAAIECYSCAIEYFKAVQSTLKDDSLISIIQAQIVQCKKTIHFYRLKDNSEQAERERRLKLTRASSVSNIKPPAYLTRPMQRHNTLQLENTFDGRGGLDSFAARIFSNNMENSTKAPSPVMKKKTKNDSQKIEELKTGYEAVKTHLDAALEDIERLKAENNELRLRKELNNLQQQVQFHLSTNLEDTNEEEDQEESENEVQDTK